MSDALSLPKAIRLLALLDDDSMRWREARKLYELAAFERGINLNGALDECDRNPFEAG